MRAATKAVSEMKKREMLSSSSEYVSRAKEETKPREAGDAFAKELADLCDVYVCDALVQRIEHKVL